MEQLETLQETKEFVGATDDNDADTLFFQCLIGWLKNLPDQIKSLARTKIEEVWFDLEIELLELEL